MVWFIIGAVAGAAVVFTIWTCCVVSGVYDEKEGTK